MRSKSPFKAVGPGKSDCSKAWAEMKEKYEAKGPNGLKQYNAEKNEFTCKNGKIVLKDSDEDKGKDGKLARSKEEVAKFADDRKRDKAFRTSKAEESVMNKK